MAETFNKLRVGIVGANWGAYGHLPAWRLLPDEIEVSAICTSRQESADLAARQFGLSRAFSSYEAMAADPDIDIIDAGTRPLLREKIVAAALNNGKHVINQMPFASSFAVASDLEMLRRDRGVVGMAATSLLGLPQLALMKEMIDAGEIGEVFQVHCSWQMSFLLQIMPGFSYLWFGKSGLGVSVTRNHGSHMLHAMRHLFGPIGAVVGQLKTQLRTWDLPDGGTFRAETDDTSHVLLRFESGAMGTMATSWTAADSPGFSLDAFGLKGRLRLTALRYPSIETAKLYAAGNDMSLLPTGSEVPVPDRLMSVAGRRVEPDPSDRYNGAQRLSLARLFEGFVGSIRDGGEPLPSFARAAEVQGIIEAIYQSSERQAWVDTPTVR